MTRLHLILSLEGPEFDNDGANDDVVGNGVVCQSGQYVFWTIGVPVYDVLDALVALGVPNLHDFVRAETDQVVTILVDVQVAH